MVDPLFQAITFNGMPLDSSVNEVIHQGLAAGWEIC